MEEAHSSNKRAILYSTKTSTVRRIPAGLWNLKVERVRAGLRVWVMLGVPECSSKEAQRRAVVHRVRRYVEREALDLILRAESSLQRVSSTDLRE